MKIQLSILTLFFSITVYAEKPQLAISTFNYPPFLKEDNSGFIDEVVKAITKRGPFSLEVSKFPPLRSIVEYKKKEKYIYLGTQDNLGDEFSKKSYFVPILEIQLRVLYLKKNKSRLSKDFSAIKKATIGIHRGAEGEITYFKKFPFDTIKYESVKQAFLLLQKERVDLVTYAPMPNKKINSFISDDQVEYHPNIPFTIFVGFFIKKSGPDSKEIFKKLGNSVRSYLSSEPYQILVERFYDKKVPEGISKYMKADDSKK